MGADVKLGTGTRVRSQAVEPLLGTVEGDGPFDRSVLVRWDEPNELPENPCIEFVSDVDIVGQEGQ